MHPLSQASVHTAAPTTYTFCCVPETNSISSTWTLTALTVACLPCQLSIAVDMRAGWGMFNFVSFFGPHVLSQQD